MVLNWFRLSVYMILYKNDCTFEQHVPNSQNINWSQGTNGYSVKFSFKSSVKSFQKLGTRTLPIKMYRKNYKLALLQG